MHRIFLLCTLAALLTAGPSAMAETRIGDMRLYPGRLGTAIVPGEVLNRRWAIENYTPAGSLTIVVPEGELSGLVRVSPSDFGPTGDGDILKFEVTIAIPDNQALDIASGYVHVVDEAGRIRGRLPIMIDITDNAPFGTDADGDGIWDDLGTWIATNHPPGDPLHAPLQQYARATQTAIVAASDRTASRNAAYGIMRAVHCLFHVDEEGSLGPEKELKVQILKHRDRFERYALFEFQLAGQIFRGPRDKRYDQSCEAG